MTTPFKAQHEFTINNKKFISNHWPTRSKAFKNLPIIGSTFAVPISVFVGSGGENLAEVTAMAAELFFQKLQEPEAQQLIDIILEDVHIRTPEGGFTKVDADLHLDDIDELLQLLAEVLKQHYGKLVMGKGSRNLFSIMVPVTQVAQQQ